jgi:UDP-N-acetyl-D-mannosaminuronic acid transferase (WecB/TagA/CpsF family)
VSARLPDGARNLRYEQLRAAPPERALTSAEEDQPVVKIVIAALVGAFLIFYIMNSPDQAAHIAKGTWHLTTHVAHGVGGFLDKLAS